MKKFVFACSLLVAGTACSSNPDAGDDQLSINAGQDRTVINIRQDGAILIEGETYYDPRAGDYDKLKQYLSQKADSMDKKHDGESGGELPDEGILIRAEENTPFKMIQKIMLLCGQEGIQIWKVELAATPPEEA